MKNKILESVKETLLQTPFKGISPESKIQFDSLVNYLLQPVVTPKDLGLTYATIKYWEQKGHLILPIIKVTDEWRKYTAQTEQMSH